MALAPIRIPTLNQINPIVDAQGRMTVEFQRRLNDTFGAISKAFDTIIKAQNDILAAQAAADTAQGSADTAQASADQNAMDIATAQKRADDAYTLADNAVKMDQGPAWTLATGTAARDAFDTATVTLPLLAAHVKALVDDLQGNGALT